MKLPQKMSTMRFKIVVDLLLRVCTSPSDACIFSTHENMFNGAELDAQSVAQSQLLPKVTYRFSEILALHCM